MSYDVEPWITLTILPSACIQLISSICHMNAVSGANSLDWSGSGRLANQYCKKITDTRNEIKKKYCEQFIYFILIYLHRLIMLFYLIRP